MMKRPVRVDFQGKVLIPVIALLTVLLAVTTWQINRQITRQVEEDAQRKLSSATRVLENALTIHSRNLLLRYRSTPNEPRVKATLQSSDPATIRYMLNELIDEVSADTIAYLDFRGELIAYAQRGHSPDIDALLSAVAPNINNGLQGEPGSQPTALKGAVYDAIVVPVLVGDSLSGVLVFVHRVGDDVAKEFAVLTGSDVFFLADGGLAATTLADARDAQQLVKTIDESNRAGSEETFDRALLHGGHVMYTVGRIKTGDTGGRLEYALSLSYESALQSLRHTQAALLLWGIAGIVVSSFFVFIVVRTVAAPLRQLADSAEAVGRGDFTRRVEVHTNDELGDLAEAFNRMIVNLQASRAELERTLVTLRRTQEELIQREKLSAIGEFIAGVTHELNNPLTAVVGFAQLLKQTNLDEHQQQDLEMIVNGAERCQKIVQSLLSFARRQKAEKKTVDINALIRGVLNITKFDLKNNNIAVAEKLDDAIPAVWADGHQLQQVFLNLITNARQAMEGRENGAIRVETGRNGNRVRIVFSDNGPGIPTENLNRIFDPFFTTKPVGKGTGLGLSLSYGIIHEHGGTIAVQSAPGTGATFVIELPESAIDPQHVSRAKPKDAVSDVAGRGERVLVIDDESAILELVSQSLSGIGYTVETALDGASALEAMDRNPYHVIVSDLKMPGLHGEQVYQQACERHPELAERFIFMTGDLISERSQRFLERVGKPCLAKPFTLDEFRAAVARLIVQKRA